MSDGLGLAKAFSEDGTLLVYLKIPGTTDVVTARLAPEDVRAVIDHLESVLAKHAAPTLH